MHHIDQGVGAVDEKEMEEEVPVADVEVAAKREDAQAAVDPD